MTTLMRGPHTIRNAVSAYLATAVPAQIAIARTQWSLDQYQLPEPVKYNAYEPYALDKYPLMGVVITNAREFDLNDVDSLAQRKYRATYSVRVFTWVRTPLDSLGNALQPEYDETLRLRDDMAAVVRAALLDSARLGNDALFWHEESLVEDYSDATPVKGDRFVAGVIHTFDMQVDESQVQTIIGTADTIESTAQSVMTGGF